MPTPLPCRHYRLSTSPNGLVLEAGVRRQLPPAPHEVVVRVHAASLNYRDLLVMRNVAGDTRDGLVPLSDAAGTVMEAGAAVTRWKLGDRVAPTFFTGWRSGPFQGGYLASMLGGKGTDGVLAETVTVAETALVAIPAHLDFEEAATLPCAGVTAWHALFARGQLQAGETVLVQGTGGVALMALQLAVAQGARVIVISSSDEKLARAKALGAWETHNYRQDPAWDAAVLRLTGGRGADHILELGGPATYDRSVAAVAAGGRIAQVGTLTGFGPTPNLLPLQFKNASVNGICVGSAEHFEALNQFLTRHRLRPVVDRRFGFDEAAAAYAHLASAAHFGKLVIGVD